ncbi:hypothetical protein VB264_24025 [Arcicella aquatica]|uniref:Uncharacterized protein n=1 Tax=Arcicella aquatica TaxID=217141 RepID=A0ABU5QUU3_9BACT|nr:hypothetical protein [Arcicella aquatica]MEA5260888.1 hypothetical protein [Arcicella aquatica]
MINEYYGILSPVDWNSNKWQDIPTKEDLKNSNFKYTKDNGVTFTWANFGNELYPTEEDGYYAGLLPPFWKINLDKKKSKLVKIVFIKSSNWKNKQAYIVGFYASPIFEKGIKVSPLDLNEKLQTNIKALPKDIFLLDNYIPLNESDELKFLPNGLKFSRQKFNYLTKENTINIMNEIINTNPKLLEKRKEELINLLN